jgi:thiopurine S-methyltransferase
MDAEFWHQKWQNNQIGFHRHAVNPFLVDYIDHLSLKAGQRLFLPLCGKTLDIAWLLSKGYQVVGVELHEPAVVALFEDLGVEPDITVVGHLKRYEHAGVTLFVGDLFDLTREDIGRVDAVYDRAAIVALPQSIRAQYAQHIMTSSGVASQLLINYEYDQTAVKGPPFSVSNDELATHYSQHYTMTLLHHSDVDGGMKGQCPATENVWLLQRY